MASLWQEDLFDEEGHLTDNALLAFIHATDNVDADKAVVFNELQRLEIAEHLSFCDKCVLRYVELLSDDSLLTPSDLVAPAVIRQLEKEERQRYFHKWVSMAMAASFAIFFWVAGVFSPNFANMDAGFLTDIVDGAMIFSRQTAEISTELTDTVSGLVEKLNWRGDISHGKE